MKKTAIVSCYFIHSYGSMLQAYATQKELDNLGYNNETINVSGFLRDLRINQYFYILKAGIHSELFQSRIARIKNMVTKKVVTNKYTDNIKMRDQKFEEFYAKYITLSQPCESLKVLKRKCMSDYKNVVIGSDQLWLPQNIAANYYTLNFVPDGINTVAYATSFGVSTLPQNAQNMAREFLPKIRHLSVREHAGQKLVKELTGRNVPVLCDPTLLLSRKDWDEIQESRPLINEPYIFCYFFGDSQIQRDNAKKVAQKIGCKIVALTHLNYHIDADDEYADITPFDVGPDGFLNLIKYATYVLTDSFHGTVFSIIYQKDFFNFRKKNSNNQVNSQSTNNRFDTLLDMFGVKDRIIYGDDDILPYLDRHIDYSKVEERLKVLQEQSSEYLVKSLDDTGSTDLSMNGVIS